jgi:hypothetical protein
MYNSTIICSLIIPASLLEPLLWPVAVECRVSSSMSLRLRTIVPQADSDSTITYQVQALDPTIPRPCCVLERTHKLFGSSLCPQPNAVIIPALTKRPTQILPLPPLPRAICSRQAYRLPPGSLRPKNRVGTKAVPRHFHLPFH